MHFMPFLTRSGHISKCLPVHTTTSTTTTATTTTTTTAINIVNIIIVAIILSFTSVRARVISHPASFQNPEELFVIEEFKRKILEQMGLSAPPVLSEEFQNGTRSRELYSKDIQDFLQNMQQDDILNNPSDVEDQSSSGDLTLRLKPSKKQLKVHMTKDSPLSSSSKIYFQFQNSFNEDSHQRLPILKSAKLRMRLKSYKHHFRHSLSFTKSQFHVNVSLVHPKTANKTFLQSFHVTSSKLSNFIEINNLEKYLSSNLFVKSPNNEIIAFEVTVTEIPHSIQHNHSNGSKLNRTRQYSNGLSSFQIRILPTLDVTLSTTKDITKTRSRRSVGDECDSNSPCCRKSIYISFEDIGWDTWVLSPEGYRAYFCKGGCPQRFKSAASFSRIKSMLHQKDPNSFPAPVCAANGYAPIRLLHMGEGNRLTWTSYPDMIVTSCSCY